MLPSGYVKIAIEHVPFSSLIYLFKMVMFHRFFVGLPGRVNHPFRWLQLPTVGEISTSLSVFTGFMHRKQDMSNITEISKKTIQLGTFHLVAEF